MKYSSQFILAISVLICCPLSAQTIKCLPADVSKKLRPHAEKACAVDHRNQPESWLKAWSKFNSESGAFNVRFKLSTDSTTAGPCGKVVAHAWDAQGNVVAKIASQTEICLGGKAPGKTADYEWSKTVTIPSDLRSQVASVSAEVTRTGQKDAIWGIELKQIADDVKEVHDIATPPPPAAPPEGTPSEASPAPSPMK